MPGPKTGFTTPHRCATVDSSRRNQPSDRDRKARQKLQEEASDFQVTLDDNVYLSLGLEAKQYIFFHSILMNLLTYILSHLQLNSHH